MWKSVAIGLVLAASLGLTVSWQSANSEPIRYRGSYTLGHEVNVFCPEMNTQCYWLSSQTPEAARESLAGISRANTREPYDSQCVVVEAEIDKDVDRAGFAADYDGLITVTSVYGLCAGTNLVTPFDLQHHRWLLERVNDEMLVAPVIDAVVPELDFGEQLHVSGNTGCNRFSGLALLRGDTIQIERMTSTAMTCSPALNNLEQMVNGVLGAPATIRLTADRELILATATVTLQYRLRDWVD